MNKAIFSLELLGAKAVWSPEISIQFISPNGNLHSAGSEWLTETSPTHPIIYIQKQDRVCALRILIKPGERGRKSRKTKQAFTTLPPYIRIIFDWLRSHQTQSVFGNHFLPRRIHRDCYQRQIQYWDDDSFYLNNFTSFSVPRVSHKTTSLGVDSSFPLCFFTNKPVPRYVCISQTPTVRIYQPIRFLIEKCEKIIATN